tara:strand:+ start:550 stop:1089 length:540 start_codon:yes stop_codon:yes gene_type:complete
MAQPIGVILQQLADFGIFFYVLPFMLIFALVFAILQKSKVLGDAEKSKGINAVISLAVALLALQFDAVPFFFQILFPKLGIALSIILAAMILVGLFVDFNDSSGKRTGASLILFSVGGILFIIILLQSFNDYSWWVGSWWQMNISAIVAGIILIVFIAVVINSGSTEKTPLPYRPYPAP